MRSRLRGVQMRIIYTSTQIIGLLQSIGLRVSIRHASDSEGTRWHRHFWMQAFTYLLVAGSAVTVIAMQARAGGQNFASYVQVGLLLVTCMFVFWPIVKLIRRYQADEDPMWLELDQGRADLFKEPVWAEGDVAAFD